MSITTIYQGKAITLNRQLGEGSEELQYRLYHSLIVHPDPLSVGIKDTNKVYGMQYGQDHGYSLNPVATSTIRRVIVQGTFRTALLDHIRKYTHLDDTAIFRIVGRTNTDSVILTALSSYMRFRDRSQEYVHTILNTLSRIPHTKITNYLNYGYTSDTLLEGVRSALSDESPIETIGISTGSFPPSWTGRFQLITIFMHMNHIEDPNTLLSEISRVLAPGGILLMMEYDYRDMTPVSTLRSEKVHQEGINTTYPNPYRMYLDAIHMIDKDPLPWSLYRSRFEWHQMVISSGIHHVCTQYKNMGTVASQMLNADNSWIVTNPGRIYHSVYLKKGLDLSLVLDYRVRRDRSIYSFFPRIGGQSGNVPDVRKGIHYNDEILAYMTPWVQAQNTSKLLSTLMKREYPDVSTYRVIDGTGGAGGNSIAFLNNRDISQLDIYERDDTFYSFLKRNIALYSRGRDGVRTYHGEFPLDRDVKGYILFLDVPWIAEGCSYKLQGYKYSGLYLEEFIRRMIERGILMIILKLPPGYQLQVHHQEYPLDKETLYIILPSKVRDASTMRIKGVDPKVEMVRYTLMSKLRDQFRLIFPELASNTFYAWIYEQLAIGDLLDPLIPKRTDVYESRLFVVSLPNMPFNEMATLIRSEYPELQEQLVRTLPFVATQVSTLRRALNDIINQRNQVTIHDRVKRLSDEVDTLYAQLGSIKGTLSISMTTKDRDRILTLRSNLSGVPRELRLLGGKAIQLKERHIGMDYEGDLASMLLRYSSMMEPTKEASFTGTNMHAAIPSTLMNMLVATLKVDTECFASPLNASLAKYMSAFPDTDAPFGSIGSFYQYSFSEGSYEANPPFTEENISLMIDHMENSLAKADEQSKGLSFFIVVPNWIDSSIDRLRISQWNRLGMVILANQHRYIAGQQHMVDTTFVAPFESYICILQSSVGTSVYPIPTDMRGKVSNSFK